MTFCGHLPFQMKSAYFSVFIQSALNCYMWHNQDPVHLTLKSTFILCCWKSYDQNVFFCFFVLYFQVAIKSIRKEKIKDEQDMVHIRREIEIMSSLRHPHIISIYEGEGLWMCTCPQTHTQLRQRHLFHSNTQTKTRMSRILPPSSSFGTRGQAVGLSCYDMQMS